MLSPSFSRQAKASELSLVFWITENVGLKRPIYIAYLDSVSVCMYVFDKSKFNPSMIISKWGKIIIRDAGTYGVA